MFFAALPSAYAKGEGTILFFGDSLTASYGLDPSQGYPALIEEKIRAAGLPWEVIVGAVSGDTSAGGLSRIDWMLQREIDVFVLAMGANDGLRGMNAPTTAKNLQAIIDKVTAKYPEAQIIIAGMQMPPTHGQTYRTAYAEVFPKLAADNDATLIPFLLQDVAGQRHLNLPDGIHPNPDGQRIVATTVWNTLQTLLE